MKSSRPLRMFAVTVGLWLAASAHAAAILSATSVTTTMGAFISATAVEKAIDQSGLSQTYTSGVTDFATFTSQATHIGLSNGSASWFSALGNRTGTLKFDLGSSQTIDGLALWNQHNLNTNDIKGFKLFDGADNLLGTYTALQGNAQDTIAAQVFAFTSVTTQFVTLEVVSNYGGQLVAIGEVAFRSATTTTTPPTPSVPEPASGALAALALGAAVCTRRRRT